MIDCDLISFSQMTMLKMFLFCLVFLKIKAKQLLIFFVSFGNLVAS